MFKLKGIKLKKLKNTLKELPRNLTEHTFLTFFGLLFVSLVLGFIIFYQYSILAEESVEISEEEIFRFDEGAYQEILNEWKSRNDKFLEINSKQYPSPF